MDGVEIYLVDGGVRVDSVMSNDLGEYLFEDVPSQDYELEVNVTDLNSGDGPYVNFVLVELRGCDNEATVDFLIHNDCLIIETFMSDMLCYGESIMIGNEEIIRDTVFVQNLISAQGCDSINNVDISFFDEITYDIDVVNSCFGKNNGKIEVNNVNGGQGPFSYSLDGITYVPGSDFSSLTDNNGYTLYFQDASNYNYSEMLVITELDEVVFDAEALSTGCVPCVTQGH